MGIFTTLLSTFFVARNTTYRDKIVRMIYEKERTCFIIYLLYLALIVNMDQNFTLPSCVEKVIYKLSNGV